MKWSKRNLDQQIRYYYLPVIVAVLLGLTLTSGLSVVRQTALMLIILLGAAFHWDLRDGGLLSRWLYSRSVSYETRNYLTVGAAFLLVTVLLAAADGFTTPLVMLYYVPVSLGAMRGGHKLSLFFSVLLAGGLISYYFVLDRLYGRVVEQGYFHAIMFVVLAAASGFIADRLRRSAVDLSALYETGRALNSTLNVAEIYPLVLNIVALDLTPDASALFMLDSQENLRIQAHQGLNDQVVKDMTIDNERSLLRHVLDSQTPTSLSSIPHKWQMPFSPELKSLMVVPLRVGEKKLGVLMVGKNTSHAYGYENLRFLEALAGQAAISIQNAWLYRQTKEWASRDALTGIYNYRYFSERLDQEWTRALRYEKPLSLIMVDLDLFKTVNDNYGHLCGDEVLREVAGLLKELTRETDMVARYGGEEFVAVLSETHFQDALLVGEKLREGVEKAIFTGGGTEHKIQLTISVGVANYPSSATNKSDLIYQADQALYRAKEIRNTVSAPEGQPVGLDLKTSDITS